MPVNHENEMLALSKELLDHCVECSTVQTRVGECKGEVFLLKYLNVVDPVKRCNNLGRSVAGGNFYRIRYALSHGFQTLKEILTLPEEKVCGGLKKFFVNALELNSGGRRPDVDARAMLFCPRRSEVFGSNGEYNSHLKHNRCHQKFGLNVPFQLSTQISPSQFQGNMLKTYNENFYCPGASSCIPTSCYPNSPQLSFSANEASSFRGMELYNPFGSYGKDFSPSRKGASVLTLNGELEMQVMHHFPPKFVNEKKLPKVCRDFHDMHINKEMNVQSGTLGSEINSKEMVELQGAGIHHLELGETGNCIIGTGLKEKSQETQICFLKSNVDENAAARERNTGP